MQEKTNIQTSTLRVPKNILESACSSRHREGKEPGRSLVYAYE